MIFTRIVKMIDRLLFKNSISNYIESKKDKYNYKTFQKNSEQFYTVYYNKNNKNFLSVLCDKYGSDKGEVKATGHPYEWASHTYTDFYIRIFQHRRSDIKLVFECGIGTYDKDFLSSMGTNGQPGASLRVWRDYFPNATIIGADIDRNILFEEERIKTFFVDQTDSLTVQDMWRDIELKNFDLMIDDGLHTFDSGCCMFENSISKLSKDGIYIIEDVVSSDLLKFQQYLRGVSFDVEYVILNNNDSRMISNNLIVLRWKRVHAVAH